MEGAYGTEMPAGFSHAMLAPQRDLTQGLAPLPMMAPNSGPVEPIPLPGSSRVSPGGAEEAVAQEKIAEVPDFTATREELERYLENMNKFSKSLTFGLRFGIYEESGQLYVQMIDRRTQSVVKTIPQEELLALRVKLEEFAGLLVDETA